MIKSFRGRLDDGTQQTIRLGTNKGLIGYSIRKFQIIGKDPINTDQEAVIQVYSINPDATPANEINFDDPTLLAVAYYENSDSPSYLGGSVVIFDSVKFNQDIYITNQSNTNVPINYYLELEQVKLDLNEATVATLKDMRGAN